MLYNEFLTQTSFSENYISVEDFLKFIEPVYMQSDDDKYLFCTKFYDLHKEKVYSVVNILLSNITLEHKISYLNGSDDTSFKKVENIQNMLLKGFLVELPKIYK